MSFGELFSSFLSAWGCGFFGSLLVVYLFLFFKSVRGVASAAALDIRGS